MAELILVPEVAAGATEVVIAEWLTEAGASVKAGDAIAVLETEKAVVEVEAEVDGTLLKILVSAGSLIQVGLPMAVIGALDETVESLEALMASLGLPDADPAAAIAAPERRVVPGLEERGSPLVTGQSPPAESAASVLPNRTFASPLARKLLRDAGVSVHEVRGTGPRGRIRRRDVEEFLSQPVADPENSQPSPIGRESTVARSELGWVDVPHSRLRRAVANRLTASKNEIPHFYVKRTAVLDELMSLRAQINSDSAQRISVNDFLIRAIAVAHMECPDVNVIWTEEATRRFEHVDVSVAIDSDRGLVTPVLRNVESTSLAGVSRQVKGFVELANAGKLQQKDLEGGSISITNLGMLGVESFAAIINPPQAAILAVGAAQPAARTEGNQLVVRTVADLVLSVDHRVVDGALAARWMGALVSAIENPMRLLV